MDRIQGIVTHATITVCHWVPNANQHQRWLRTALFVTPGPASSISSHFVFIIQPPILSPGIRVFKSDLFDSVNTRIMLSLNYLFLCESCVKDVEAK